MWCCESWVFYSMSQAAKMSEVNGRPAAKSSMLHICVYWLPGHSSIGNYWAIVCCLIEMRQLQNWILEVYFSQVRLETNRCIDTLATRLINQQHYKQNLGISSYVVALDSYSLMQTWCPQTNSCIQLQGHEIQWNTNIFPVWKSRLKPLGTNSWIMPDLQRSCAHLASAWCSPEGSLNTYYCPLYKQT